MQVPARATIHVTYREDTAPFAMSRHHHTSHELILVTAGRARFHVNDRCYEVGPGDLLLISNMEPHDVDVIEWPYCRHYIHLDPDALQSVLRDPELVSLFRRRPAAFCHLIRLAPEEARLAAETFRGMATEQASAPPCWEGCMESALRLFLITLYRTHPTCFPPLEVTDTALTMLSVQRHLDMHETEDLRLDDVARLFHFDPYHLCRAFHHTTGFHFKEYLIRRRVNRAADLLRGSADSVAQVAAACGFNSVPHFIRTFRRVTGTTPLQYRKKG